MRLVKRLQRKRGENFAHFLREKAEVALQVLRPPREVLPQLGLLRRYAHWAAVHVAPSALHAAERDEHGRSERELVSAEHGGYDYVAPSPELAVYLQLHAAAEAVLHERLVRFGKP